MITSVKRQPRIFRYNITKQFSTSLILRNKLPNNSNSNSKSRLNLPPSFRSSRPIQNQISDIEKERINNSTPTNQEIPITYKKPWWIPLLKIAVVVLPCLIVGSGYIIYETVNNRTVFFPFKINSVVPLNEAKGFENVDLELLKSTATEILLRRLNINHEVREYIGLPISLGQYESFDVSVKYNKLAVEGIELDFRKSWIHPSIKYREIDTPQLPPNINKYVQPLKERVSGGIDEDPDQDSIFLKEVDYKLIIRATIPIIHEKLHRIEPGSAKITFDAEVELDHTRLMKIVSALLHFRNKNGTGSGGTLEKLW